MAVYETSYLTTRRLAAQLRDTSDEIYQLRRKVGAAWRSGDAAAVMRADVELHRLETLRRKIREAFAGCQDWLYSADIQTGPQ